MTVESWLETFDETIDSAGFRHAAAGALAGFMIRYGASVGSFVEGRRRDDQELVVLDLRTAAPQRPFYAIRRAERVGILFVREDAQPLVTMLRDDFPDTEHQQLVPEGCPATICIDDRPWSEAVLTWTPAELVERILSWFRRAGRGELHDARQPLDPGSDGKLPQILHCTVGAERRFCPEPHRLARSDRSLDPARSSRGGGLGLSLNGAVVDLRLSGRSRGYETPQVRARQSC